MAKKSVKKSKAGDCPDCGQSSAIHMMIGMGLMAVGLPPFDFIRPCPRIPMQKRADGLPLPKDPNVWKKFKSNP